MSARLPARRGTQRGAPHGFTVRLRACVPLPARVKLKACLQPTDVLCDVICGAVTKAVPPSVTWMHCVGESDAQWSAFAADNPGWNVYVATTDSDGVSTSGWYPNLYVRRVLRARRREVQRRTDCCSCCMGTDCAAFWLPRRATQGQADSCAGPRVARAAGADVAGGGASGWHGKPGKGACFCAGPMLL